VISQRSLGTVLVNSNEQTDVFYLAVLQLQQAGHLSSVTHNNVDIAKMTFKSISAQNATI